jgi:hypothetical protein
MAAARPAAVSARAAVALAAAATYRGANGGPLSTAIAYLLM